MARKFKTYRTSLGFFDQAIAAPSMKAALEAWGTTTNLFHQGVAKEVDDPDIIAAAMRKPGVILRRPVGSNGSFKEHAELPTHLPGAEDKGKRKMPCEAKSPTSPPDRRSSSPQCRTGFRERTESARR